MHNLFAVMTVLQMPELAEAGRRFKMSWDYIQPVQIIFGNGKINELKKYAQGMNRIILVAGPHFSKSSLIEKIKDDCNIIDVFDNISPNPDVEEVNECSRLIRDKNIDGIIAIGGGSTLDLAKAASVAAEKIEEYYLGEKSIPKDSIPLIAIPTTAGTGSEVTSVAVLTDRKNGRKAPISSDSFFPRLAIVDPELTWTLSPYMTAVSGIDVLCHAIEGYWSKGHQPICDTLAIYAVKLVLEYLPLAYKQPKNAIAREKMAEASVIAGMAFALPKTTSSHACSFPLTNLYGIPHGEACGLTIDYFIKINSDDKRTRILADSLGFDDTEKFAKAVKNLKEELNLRLNLQDLNLDEVKIEELVRESKHPNLLNNPVFISDDILRNMYRQLS